MVFRGVCTVIELLLGLIMLPVFKGEPQLIGSPDPVVGLVGHYCVLPCSVQPAESVAEKTVEWTRSNLNPSYVHIFRQGRLLHDDVNPSFLQRANLFEQELRNGNMSLKLSDLKISDAGTYTCKLITRSETFIQVSVIIGAVSEPQIFAERFVDELVFKCEAKNWYPEPEMEWRDSEGEIVPPDDIYTEHDDEYYSVYSEIKVEIAAHKNYTCTVQQKDIGEVRALTYTPPEVFGENASLKILTLHLRGWLGVILVLFLFALILGGMALAWAGKNLVLRTDADPDPDPDPDPEDIPAEENGQIRTAQPEEEPEEAVDGIPLVQLPARENRELQDQLELLQQQNADLTEENGRLKEEVERLSRYIQDLTEAGTSSDVTADTETQRPNCSSDD